MKTNQLKAESKPLVNKKSTLKLMNLTPPTSLQVIPFTTPQKSKSNKAVTPKKAKIPVPLVSKKKTETFIPSQTSSPLPTSKNISQLPNPRLSPIPNKGTANARLQELQVSLEKQQSILSSDEVLVQQSASNTSTNQFSEDMDWEPSDDFSSSCVSEATDNNNDRRTMSEYYDNFHENSFKSSSSSNRFEMSYSHTDFYFVVDTNVLLDNLTFIKDLSETVFAGEFFILLQSVFDAWYWHLLASPLSET